jgi:hypothetical protein
LDTEKSVIRDLKSREKVVPVERIELPTFGLQNRCSTAELNRLKAIDRIGVGDRIRMPHDGCLWPQAGPRQPAHVSPHHSGARTFGRAKPGNPVAVGMVLAFRVRAKARPE